MARSIIRIKEIGDGWLTAGGGRTGKKEEAKTFDLITDAVNAARKSGIKDEDVTADWELVEDNVT